jgi:hypothetical protein
MTPLRLPAAMSKASKYGAKKTTIDGIVFDSKAEAARWVKLEQLQHLGKVTDLRRQVPIELVPGAKLHGAKRARPAIRLVVDFTYTQDGAQVWEDVKGMETPLSLAKRHMAKALKGIDVRVVR